MVVASQPKRYFRGWERHSGKQNGVPAARFGKAMHLWMELSSAQVGGSNMITSQGKNNHPNGSFSGI